jgi:ELWxxDGT repeat protein
MSYVRSRLRWDEVRLRLARGWARRRLARGQKGRRRARRLLVEGLEERNLLASTPQMLVDLNPGGWSWASEFTAVGEAVYFSNDGADLWKTDGTPGNTLKVKTITDPHLGAAARIVDFVNAGGVLAFVAVDDNDTWNVPSDDRVQLWKSNGTAAGTLLVWDFGARSSAGDFGNTYLTAVGGSVFTWSRTSIQARTARILLTSWRLVGNCISPPTMVRTARSCGSAMAPRVAPRW